MLKRARSKTSSEKAVSKTIAPPPGTHPVFFEYIMKQAADAKAFMAENPEAFNYKPLPKGPAAPVAPPGTHPAFFDYIMKQAAAAKEFISDNPQAFNYKPLPKGPVAPVAPPGTHPAFFEYIMAQAAAAKEFISANPQAFNYKPLPKGPLPAAAPVAPPGTHPAFFDYIMAQAADAKAFKAANPTAFDYTPLPKGPMPLVINVERYINMFERAKQKKSAKASRYAKAPPGTHPAFFDYIMKQAAEAKEFIEANAAAFAYQPLPRKFSNTSPSPQLGVHRLSPLAATPRVSRLKAMPDDAGAGEAPQTDQYGRQVWTDDLDKNKLSTRAKTQFKNNVPFSADMYDTIKSAIELLTDRIQADNPQPLDEEEAQWLENAVEVIIADAQMYGAPAKPVRREYPDEEEG